MIPRSRVLEKTLSQLAWWVPGVFKDGWAFKPVAPAAVPSGRGRHHTSFLHLLVDQHGLETRSQTAELHGGCSARALPALSKGLRRSKAGARPGRIAGGSGRAWGLGCAKREHIPASCGLKAGAEHRFWFLCVPYLAAAGTLLSALVQLWQKVGCQLSGEQGCAALRCQNSTAMPLCVSKIRYKRDLLSH